MDVMEDMGDLKVIDEDAKNKCKGKDCLQR